MMFALLSHRHGILLWDKTALMHRDSKNISLHQRGRSQAMLYFCSATETKIFRVGSPTEVIYSIGVKLLLDIKTSRTSQLFRI